MKRVFASKQLTKNNAKSPLAVLLRLVENVDRQSPSEEEIFRLLQNLIWPVVEISNWNFNFCYLTLNWKIVLWIGVNSNLYDVREVDHFNAHFVDLAKDFFVNFFPRDFMIFLVVRLATWLVVQHHIVGFQVYLQQIVT